MAQEKAAPSNCYSTPRTPHQIGLYQNLTELWDAAFDAEFGLENEVEVGKAVCNMINFLIKVSVWNSDLPTICCHSGDFGLVSMATQLIYRRFPAFEDICLRLQILVKFCIVKTKYLERFKKLMVFCVGYSSSYLYQNRN